MVRCCVECLNKICDHIVKVGFLHGSGLNVYGCNPVYGVQS